MILADFASEYTIRLEAEPMSFGEFRPLLQGLLSSETRLWLHFTPKQKRS